MRAASPTTTPRSTTIGRHSISSRANRPEAAGIGASQSDRATSTHIVWFAVLLLLCALALTALWYPVQRISQYADINYNEGWNTYRADMAARGDPLYARPPR